MNAKIEQKKEYLKPQMTVLGYEYEGVLLDASCEPPLDDGSVDLEILDPDGNPE